MIAAVCLEGLLKEINVLCRDDGKQFTDTRRLEVIEKELRESEYVLKKGNLFRLYSKKPVSEIKGKILLVSSHVDCEKDIKKCFSRNETAEMLRGTYDNSITNAAILALMKEGTLPEAVIVAFTGDEEIESGGAKEVAKYRKKKNKKFQAVVLDVTDAGWEEDADFTVENNFWNKKTGQRVCDTADELGYPWLFVPKKRKKRPDYIPKNRVYSEEAEQDESWEYDEQNVKCFSLCLPVYGEMHSDKGVLARKQSFIHYVEMLNRVCHSLCVRKKGQRSDKV